MKIGTLIPTSMLAEIDLEKLSSLGFDVIELSLESRFEGRGRLNPVGRTQLLERLKNAHIEVTSLCAGWLFNPVDSVYLGSADVRGRGQAVSAVRETMALCKELGGSTVLIPFFGEADLRSPEVRRRTIESLKKIAQAEENNGIKLGLETTLPADQVNELIKNIDSKIASCYWDAGNTMCMGFDPEVEISTLASNIAAVHVKEFLPDSTWKPLPVASGLPGREYRMFEFQWLNTVPLGRGAVPIAKVIKHLISIGYDGPITYECFPSKLSNPIEAFSVAAAALKESLSLS